MKLTQETYSFILLTPAMIGGANGKNGNAEMRIASIRGQVRWWHRKANFSPGCNEVWGQTEPNVIASKVSLALEPCLDTEHCDADILPHDLKKSGRPRDAISPGVSHTLTLRRLVGCTNDQWKTAQKAVKLWLLLGGLGLRVNRAAGSVWPVDDWAPDDAASLRTLLEELGYNYPVRLADPSSEASPQNLRRAASDTVSEPRYFGGINPRKSSPLKMKVALLGDSLRLLLTGLSDVNMNAARQALGTGKDLGRAEWHSI